MCTVHYLHGFDDATADEQNVASMTLTVQTSPAMEARTQELWARSVGVVGWLCMYVCVEMLSLFI